jgi:transposase
MANKTISMSKIRHLLQLYSQGRSKLLIAQQTGIARNTIKKYLNILAQSGINIEELQSWSDKRLESLFVKAEEKPLNTRLQVLFGLFPALDKELRKKGITRQLLWQGYKLQHPEGVGRSQFNHYFAQWKKQTHPTMRMDHKVGDKMYVDFAGDKLQIVDPHSGEIVAVEVFVAILGASQLTYVEAVMSQQKEDFIGACENAMHYYTGVPAAIVPDNLKAAVTKSSKYEPVINETFADFARHYNTAILPARSYKPRDKALVENAVRNIYQSIYTKLQGQIFHTLEQLNQSIGEELLLYNQKLLTGRNYSRRQQFEEIERMALLPLPDLRYELKKQLFVTVMKNGHVCLKADKHYYSVPYRYIGKKVKLRYCRNSVEIYHNYERIALHERIISPYQYTTDKEHMASSHRFVSDWNPEKFLLWAADIHEDVRLYITEILHRKQHPEQAYKSCVGILSFTKKVGNERLIKACQRALEYGSYNYKTIQRILENGLENQPQEAAEQLTMPLHDNIRGHAYYQ